MEGSPARIPLCGAPALPPACSPVSLLPEGAPSRVPGRVLRGGSYVNGGGIVIRYLLNSQEARLLARWSRFSLSSRSLSVIKKITTFKRNIWRLPDLTAALCFLLFLISSRVSALAMSTRTTTVTLITPGYALMTPTVASIHSSPSPPPHPILSDYKTLPCHTRAQHACSPDFLSLHFNVFIPC